MSSEFINPVELFNNVGGCAKCIFSDKPEYCSLELHGYKPCEYKNNYLGKTQIEVLKEVKNLHNAVEYARANKGVKLND